LYKELVNSISNVTTSFNSKNW